MNQYDIYEIYTEDLPIYLITPRKNLFQSIGFGFKLLYLDCQRNKSLNHILNKLYKSGFRFVSRKKRPKKDKLYQKERNYVHSQNAKFVTDGYNKKIGRIGFDQKELEKLYHIHRNIFGMLD